MFRIALPAIAALILAGVTTLTAAPLSQFQSPGQSQAQPRVQAPSSQARSQSDQLRSASGKITSVSGDKFSIEIGTGDTKRTMEFTTNSSTAKSGNLQVGSNVVVQYRSSPGGQNTATKVDVEG
jgi:hypothetical protein